MADAYIVLSELEKQGLAEQARLSPFPKWSTLCLLRTIGCPTLDACYVPPGMDGGGVHDAVHGFARKTCLTHVALRSDGGIESTQYYRGGHVLPLNRAIEVCRDLVGKKRAVVLVEPTNRFRNRLNLNVLFDRRGDFIIEILGQGYDTSDLNRGGIRPQIVIRAGGCDWTRFSRVHRSALSVSVDLEPSAERARRGQRLSRIARELLPPLDVHCAEPCEEQAREWLLLNGHCALWAEEPPSVTIHDVRHWHEHAFMIGLTYKKSWMSLVYSASRLEDGRMVHWDVVDGGRKYGFAENRWSPVGAGDQ